MDHRFFFFFFFFFFFVIRSFNPFFFPRLFLWMEYCPTLFSNLFFFLKSNQRMFFSLFIYTLFLPSSYFFILHFFFPFFSPSTTKNQFQMSYDKLVITVGAVNNTFGINGVKENALFLKEVSDARKIRQRVIECNVLHI